jgi:hypothetical protein
MVLKVTTSEFKTWKTIFATANQDSNEYGRIDHILTEVETDESWDLPINCFKE